MSFVHTTGIFKASCKYTILLLCYKLVCDAFVHKYIYINNETQITIPTPADILTDGVDRLLLIFRNPNRPIGRAIQKIRKLTEKTVNRELALLENSFERGFDSNETQVRMTLMLLFLSFLHVILIDGTRK